VWNSAEKELRCINEIQVKIGAAVADSVSFSFLFGAKFRQKSKNKILKRIFWCRFLEILKKNRKKKRKKKSF
jgi:hypothetical protein